MVMSRQQSGLQWTVRAGRESRTISQRSRLPELRRARSDARPIQDWPEDQRPESR